MVVMYDGDNFIEAFDSGYVFNESDLEEIVSEYGIGTDYDDNLCWVRPAYTIVCFDNRYFGIPWSEGLTEMQPNEFYDQPEELFRVEREKTIKVVEYYKKTGPVATFAIDK